MVPVVASTVPVVASVVLVVSIVHFVVASVELVAVALEVFVAAPVILVVASLGYRDMCPMGCLKDRPEYVAVPCMGYMSEEYTVLHMHSIVMDVH